MKEKIIMFGIGLLVGAILASGIFLIINKNTSTNCERPNIQMKDGNRPVMPTEKEGRHSTNDGESSSEGQKKIKKDKNDSTKQNTDKKESSEKES